MSRGIDGIAAFWPANGILLAAILLAKPGTRRWHLFAGTTASVLVNWGTGSGLELAAAFTLANVTTVALIYVLLRRCHLDRDLFDDGAAIVNFLLIVVAGVSIGAGMAATAVALAGGDFTAAWLSWTMSDVIGIVLVTSFLLTCASHLRGRPSGLSVWPYRKLVAGQSAIVMATTAVFVQSQYPMLFVPLAVLVLTTYRTGLIGAVAGALAIAVTGSLLTATGLGPIALINGSTTLRIEFLQFYLITVYATCLPQALLLAERQRLAARLTESDRRHRRILDQTRMVIFETDLKGCWTYLNPAWEAMTGWSIEASLGRSSISAVAPADRAAAIERGAQLNAGELRECHQEMRYRHAHPGQGDDERWATVSSYLLTDADGKVVGTYGTMRDITPQRRAEDARLKSDGLYRLLAENSNDMIVQFSPDGVRRYVSPASRVVLGCEPHELLNETAVGEIHPDDRSTVIATCQTLLTGVENPICTYRQRHKKGHYVWLEASYRILRDPSDATPTGFIASVRDVGRRRQAELDRARSASELREANRLLTIAEGMGRFGHWRVDLASSAVFWSDGVCDIHGQPAGYQPTLQSAIDVYHPDDRPAVRAWIDEVLKNGDGRPLQARLMRSDGAIRHIVSRGRTERGPDGAAVGLFGIVQDVTEAREAEQALRDARQQAEAAARAKADFLAHMSHEIRTPMNGVIGFTDLLLASGLTPQQRRQAELIAESGKAMMRLLNDILDLSKVEAGQMSVASEPFDLVHTLTACMSLIGPAAAQKAIAVDFELASDLPAIIVGDDLRLRQIVLNLLGNAVKFTERGTIGLRASITNTADPHIVIEIRDTGVGIAPDRQAAVFEEFVQAESGTAARFGGTGLGLSISAQLAALMGGGLTLSSVVGEGSSFFLTLPLHDAERIAPAAKSAEIDPAIMFHGVSGLRVLVAEDHDVNQMLMRAMLERFKCNVDIAADGAAAVDAVMSARALGRPYGLVLMDMQMPEMDGIAATRRIRAAGVSADELPILALTANAYADDIDACLNAGMQAHLAKPMHLDPLRAALRRWTVVEPAVDGPAPNGPRRFSAKVEERYRQRKTELMARLADMLGAGSFADDDMRALVDLHHKLAGTAAMFGDGALGRQAAVFERAAPTWPADERREHMTRHLQAMRLASVSTHRDSRPAAA